MMTHHAVSPHAVSWGQPSLLYLGGAGKTLRIVAAKYGSFALCYSFMDSKKLTFGSLELDFSSLGCIRG